MNLVQQVPLQEKPTTGFQDIVDAGTLDNIHTVVEDLRTRLAGRVVWNINSTASGGGVAEMLHSLLAYARGLGVDTRWLVIQGNADFFRVTKRLHNALHGQAGDDLGHPHFIHRDAMDGRGRRARDLLLDEVRQLDPGRTHQSQVAEARGGRRTHGLEPELEVSAPRELFRGDFRPAPAFNSNDDVSPDGERFLMIRPTGDAPREIHVIVNWVQELERLVPKDN